MVLISLLCKRVFVLSRGGRLMKKWKGRCPEIHYLRQKYRTRDERKKRREQHISSYERGKGFCSSKALLAALFV
jgi:hypothetical protein